MRPNNDSNAPKLDAPDWLAREAERLAVEGRLAESERMLGRLLALQEQAIEGTELELADTLGMRGEVRFLANDLLGAEEDFRRALAIRERCAGRRHPETAGSQCSLALVLWRRGERVEAEPLLSRCLDIRRSLLGDDHPETVRTLSRLKTLWRELAGMEDDVATTQQDELEAWVEFSGATVLAEWTALRDQFGELSRRLLDAAQRDRGLPAEQVMRELADCRLGFQRLCDEARGWAEAFRVPCPPAAELENLLGIAAFLDRIGAAVMNEERTERPRRRALLIVEQVLRLTHSVDPQFAPLDECRERALSVCDRIRIGAESITDAVRPFYDLLLLAHQRNTLSDEAWARLHQSVSSAFGKALAAAATRGHLIPSAAALASHARGPRTSSIPATLQPRFARPDGEYVIPVPTVPLIPVEVAPPVIGGPLSIEASAARPARGAAGSGGVRFRTADGKLYTLMAAEPVAGPKGIVPVVPAPAGETGARPVS